MVDMIGPAKKNSIFILVGLMIALVVVGGIMSLIIPKLKSLPSKDPMATAATNKSQANSSLLIDASLGEIRDRIETSKTPLLLVNLWASWCGPCMKFLPELQAFYSKYKGTQLEILGVSLDDNKEAWTGTVESHKISWKLVSDLKGWKCEGSRAYAVNSIPSTVLIDKSGKIVGKNLSIPEMEKLILEKSLVWYKLS